MITPLYCQKMTQYNHWQNNGLREHVQSIHEDELRADRGLFFASILATLDHIVWADQLWLNRLDPSIEVPPRDGETGQQEWLALRPQVDSQLASWADALTQEDLEGEVVWTSQIYKKEFRTPRDLAITHLFNHQTHHRGQIHAALTAMGRKTMDTDIVFMSEH